MSATREQILAELSQVTDPVSARDIISADLVRALVVEGRNVRFVLDVSSVDHARALAPVQTEAERRIRALGMEPAIVITAPGKSAAPKGPVPELGGRKAPPRAAPAKLPGVAHIVAIASGKGGVGKSTLAANLAVALAQDGLRVGLLDADVYGPSQPRMMGCTQRPASPDGKIIEPPSAHGVVLMSLGLMLPEGEAAIWRGPMLMGALQQMLTQVAWGELDVLLVDLPPGTGDVPLSLAQKVEVSGAVVVSTPQDIALLDVRKGIAMFQKLGTPILGLIENMSTHVCSQCGHEEALFGHGGVREEAQRLGAPLLAEIPLALAVREAGDKGTPVVLSEPQAPQSVALRLAARRLYETLQSNEASK